MNRVELIEKKNRLETEARKVTNFLKNARREFAITGKGLPRVELANMESKEAFLKSELQRTSAELGTCKDSKKAMKAALQEEFINVARVLLDDDSFKRILKKAGDIAADRVRGNSYGDRA